LLNSISCCFRDTGLQAYWGHDLTFRVTWRHRLRDHSIPHGPWSFETEYISSRFRDIAL